MSPGEHDKYEPADFDERDRDRERRRLTNAPNRHRTENDDNENNAGDLGNGNDILQKKTNAFASIAAETIPVAMTNHPTQIESQRRPNASCT